MTEIVQLKYIKRLKIKALSANESYRLPMVESDMSTHKFCNEIIIDNANGTSEVEITLDNAPDKTINVEKGMIWQWTFKDDNIKFREVLIKENDGSPMAADLLKILVIKKRYQSINISGDDY